MEDTELAIKYLEDNWVEDKTSFTKFSIIYNDYKFFVIRRDLDPIGQGAFTKLVNYKRRVKKVDGTLHTGCLARRKKNYDRD